MVVGSGTVEAERHIIGSGREEQDIGEQFFDLVHLAWLEAIILVSQGSRRETSLFGVAGNDMRERWSDAGKAEMGESDEHLTRIGYLRYP